MLVVLTISFGALLAVLEGVGAVKTEPDLGSRAIWDSEVFFAWQLHKKIIAVVPPGKPVSPWLRYHVETGANGGGTIFEGTEEEAVATLL